MAALFVLLVLMAFAFVLDCFMRAVRSVQKARRDIDNMPLPPKANVSPLYPQTRHVRLVSAEEAKRHA